jgi:hypothetical protein
MRFDAGGANAIVRSAQNIIPASATHDQFKQL